MHLLPSASSSHLKLQSSFWFCTPNHRSTEASHRSIVWCAKRSGKKLYPSEKKKKLKLKQKELLSSSKIEGGCTWRLYKLGVPLDEDPGKDSLHLSDRLMQEIAKLLNFPVASLLPKDAFLVVRKSFDARKDPKFVHTVDMDVQKLVTLEPSSWDFISQLEPKVGFMELLHYRKDSAGDLVSIIRESKENKEGAALNGETGHGHNIFSKEMYRNKDAKKPKIAVVGSGPAGLFATLVLAELGADVTLIERGQPVEKRGRDIGALVVRQILQLESNFCFGEGGAGTWSDGKLVTRIGRNSGSVLAIMRTLVRFGAPKQILIDGKPHLGTNRLVPLLRNFRQHLQDLGVTIKFGTRVDDLLIEDGNVLGVMVSESADELRLRSQKMEYDAVILAVGHSARDIYQMLLTHNVKLTPKDFAVGLRIEHPQELINRIQYAELASEVCRGRGKVPVADYKIANYIDKNDFYDSSDSNEANRSCYSFCMCPGGQVVLTSTNPSEMCINGMSFSQRASRWANAALVVTVTMRDFEALNYHGPLAGVEFQREFEQRAAIMGGGNFKVPVQTVTDFLENKLSVTSLPTSSYRLGVKAANLDQIYPVAIVESLKRSLVAFDKELPGFICNEALLHGVETRTSSPIQIPRDDDSYESTSVKRLYPVGEGAGYAGGIISAAADGMHAGFAVAKKLNLFDGDIKSLLGNPQNYGFVKY